MKTSETFATTMDVFSFIGSLFVEKDVENT